MPCKCLLNLQTKLFNLETISWKDVNFNDLLREGPIL